TANLRAGGNGAVRCNGLLDSATLSFRFTFKIPSRVPRVSFLFRADEAVFEVPSITPPSDEPAPPAPANERRRCDLHAAIDLPRGHHPVPRRFTNPRPQIGRRRNPSTKPSS